MSESHALYLMEGDRGGGVPPKAEKKLSTPRLFFESRMPLGPAAQDGTPTHVGKSLFTSSCRIRRVVAHKLLIRTPHSYSCLKRPISANLGMSGGTDRSLEDVQVLPLLVSVVDVVYKAAEIRV